MRNLNPVSYEGTVVGILFTKTGEEVKEAIDNKVEGLLGEVEDYQKAIADVDDFLEKKEKELVGISELYTNRENDKDALARPFRRQLDEVHKSWDDKAFEFNKETNKLVGAKAVTFEKGFSKFEDVFAEIDELSDEVSEMDRSDDNMYLAAAASATSAGAVSVNMIDTSDLVGSSRNMLRKSGQRTNGGRNAPTKQDEALSQINTLRDKVYTYSSKVSTIKRRIKTLLDEAEELQLIGRHLKNTKEYILDLERLAAFGFEA